MIDYEQRQELLHKYRRADLGMDANAKLQCADKIPELIKTADRLENDLAMAKETITALQQITAPDRLQSQAPFGGG